MGNETKGISVGVGTNLIRGPLFGSQTTRLNRPLQLSVELPIKRIDIDRNVVVDVSAIAEAGGSFSTYQNRSVDTVDGSIGTEIQLTEIQRATKLLLDGRLGLRGDFYLRSFPQLGVSTGVTIGGHHDKRTVSMLDTWDEVRNGEQVAVARFSDETVQKTGMSAGLSAGLVARRGNFKLRFDLRDERLIPVSGRFTAHRFEPTAPPFGGTAGLTETDSSMKFGFTPRLSANLQGQYRF